MRAMRITDQHTLELAELPEPVPAPGEVLVDVIAAGINRADLIQVAGHYPPPPGASPLPGLEVSGRRRDTGEEVVALLAGGGYAEVVAVPEAQLLPLPAGADPVDAAGIIEVGATVISNLVLEAGIREGETLLIHGGTGGIGTAAIQIARALGVRVLAVAGSDEGVAQLRALGADHAWNRRTADVAAQVLALGGADVILDVIGGSALAANVGMLREHGRLVIIGTMGGASGELPIGALMARRGRVIATALRTRAVADKQAVLARTREILWPMLEDGRVRLPIHARLPLEEAADAQALLREGGHLGKVLLVL